jgi:hypothetical protein
MIGGIVVGVVEILALLFALLLYFRNSEYRDI